MKRFRVLTLVDITETRQNRKEANKDFEYQQQQNFVTLLQAIGMRVNPLYQNSPKMTTENLKAHNFGSAFTGSHTVWSWDFMIEYEDGFTDEHGDETGLLVSDLNLVPVITGLKETAKFTFNVFNTKSDTDRNTYILII